MTRFRSAILVSIVVAVHTTLWAIALPALRFPYPPRTALAQYLSTLALVIVSVNLILATRARPVESAFGGLDKVFASHRLNGIVAATAVLLHVTIVPLTTPLWGGRTVGIVTLLLLQGSVALAIAPRAPWRRLLEVRYQTWKAEHRFMGVFVAAAAWHSMLVPTLVRKMPIVRGWVFGVVALGLVCYAYRETWFRFWARRHRYSVGVVQKLPGRVLEARLDGDRAPIAHRAGQFGFVRFDAGPSRERHPFTVSSPPNADGSLRFSIKASGDYTDALQAGLAQGSSASVEGPYGRFDFMRGRRRQLWLAGGIGITPFLAFLPALDPEREVTLVWSVRSAEEAVYRAEIEKAVAGRPRCSAAIWSTAEKGHVELGLLGLERPEELSVYVCGPVVMREAFVEQLHALGVHDRDIHFEEFTLR